MSQDDAAPVRQAAAIEERSDVEVQTIITSANDMATEEQVLRELIGTTLAASPDASAEVSIALLRSLDKSLNNIIGAEGFNSLLFRTAYQVGHTYPWFRFDPRTLPADPDFVALGRCFDGQDPEQAQAASMHFFNIFIDVLASLIGAHLTTLFLNSAISGASAAASKQQGAE